MTNNPRPRLLYYCQSLVGIGHLTASLHIIKELLNTFDVDLIYGGINYQAFYNQDGFRVLRLPTLLFDAVGDLYCPDHNYRVTEVWQHRQTAISAFLNPSYCGIVLEFYPFGRRRFKQEIRWLCRKVKNRNGEIPVFSQIREILIPEEFATEQAILATVQAEIHTVLVRGDPNVVRLDETFSLTNQLGDQLFYGGYVSARFSGNQSPRKPQILTSQGGGNVGMELLFAVIKTAAFLPEYHFIIASGSSCTESEIAALQSAVASTNVEIVPFLADFRNQLAQSVLSINMGGDNTLLDVIATQTPSLAFPYPGNSEQTIRIEKLAQHGWVTPIYLADLNPESLQHHIRASLDKAYPIAPINLNGAVNICEKIREIVDTPQS